MRESGVTYQTRNEERYGTLPRAVIRLTTPVLPIHIVGCAETRWADLLDTFDISTHRWAQTRDGVRLRGLDATTVFEPGRVLYVIDPVDTERRRKKLEDRYGITIAPYEPPARIAAPQMKKAKTT